MMTNTLALAPLLMAALAAAALAWLGMAVALHRTGRVQHGYLHWVMPALLLIMAAGVWLSGRARPCLMCCSPCFHCCCWPSVPSAS
jgi:hypothetical protein